MITKFTIGNFLSYKDKQTLSFLAGKQDTALPEALSKIHGETLVKTVALYGANASGKSNLTKAFAFVRNFVVNGLKQLENTVPVESFLLSNETERKPSFLELEIVVGKDLFKYGFEVSTRKVHKEWLHQYPNKKVLFERRLDNIKVNPRHFKEGVASTRKQTRKNVLFLSVVASFDGPISTKVVDAIKKIQVVSGLNRLPTLNYSFGKYTKDEKYREWMNRFVLEADLGISKIITEEKQLTAEEFAKTVPPHLKDQLMAGKSNFFERKLTFIHRKFDSKGKSVGTVSFNFFKESDGTQQAFALSGPFKNTLEESNTLVIDELDSSLHPLMCRYILKVFNSSDQNMNNAQLIFTTHDISLLDEDLLRRDQIWFAQKDKFGASELFSLMDLKERSNLNFAKRYLEGRYGALPYIKRLEDID
jgi:AAA15 family ATPase/GTPase